MPDADNNFVGSLGLDFRKWWRHVQPKNSYVIYAADAWKSCILIAGWNVWGV